MKVTLLRYPFLLSSLLLSMLLMALIIAGMYDGAQVLTSYLVWGAWLALFTVLELTSVFWAGCPWRTLSRSVWELQVRFGWPVTALLIGGLADLTVHLVRAKNLNEGDKPQ